MANQYLLVDFENVQPDNLGALQPGEWRILVFLGQHQTRLELGLVQAVQAFGSNAEYIQIVGNGKDALDFHIAFYIGKLAAEQPGARFVIVSKDTGFDPLVKHLEKLRIACKRVATIPGAAVKLPTTKAAPVAKAAKVVAKAPAKQPAKQVAKPAKKAAAKKIAMPPRFEEVVERLKGMKHAKPRTVRTFRSSLGSFNPPFAEAQIDAMLQALQSHGVLTVAGTKLVYPA
ncbi:hypothetical protein LF41_1459 [Lysobacter dokdonensis DS-58]|uniref:PIN-like domain-containing protein n=1 Tax=Lysobacter dokdonensis DS-58 TaxID=1300345 RepID=A0A0A2WIN2_9GAMM|nr:PIN domain-containing protein [Lysobacter dokdonensis]KGQ18105.1 hypothetical protein LF41_1459 [Lysobacter dokdonensis DS-58]